MRQIFYGVKKNVKLDNIMAQTYAQQLDSVQAAITAIEGGAQSYSVNGLSYTRGNLETLYKREERLLTLINQASNGPLRTVVKF
jgi:hypothetical protein